MARVRRTMMVTKTWMMSKYLLGGSYVTTPQGDGFMDGKRDKMRLGHCLFK